MLKASNYINAIESTISSWGIPTVLFNPDFNDEDELEELPTPAVFILCEMMNGTAYSNSGNGSLVESVEIELVCLIAKESNESEAAKKAFNLASFVKRKSFDNNWGLGRSCGKPENIKAINLTGNLPGYTEWRVSFNQIFEVDPMVETEYEFKELFLGINPQNNSDYESIGYINDE